MRTKRLKNYTFKQESAVIITEIVLVWNQIENAKSNLTNSSLTYKTGKIKLEKFFLSVVNKDTSIVTYRKAAWKQYKNYLKIKL